MPSEISGNHVHSPYYHWNGDATQTKTAQRATFSPTWGNKISNHCLSSDSVFLKPIGKGIKLIRDMDLSFRGKMNDVKEKREKSSIKRNTKRGAAILFKDGHFENKGQIDEQVKLALEKNCKNVNVKYRLKNIRLEYKEDINKTTDVQNLKSVIEMKNSLFQGVLEKEGYIPITDLSKVNVPTIESGYLSNASGHRVKLHDTKAPFLPRKIAKETGQQYDTGVTGMERTFRRSVQLGAVGIDNAFLFAKQGLYKGAAALSPADSETRDTFVRHAYKAQDARRLNTAALKGNVVLGDEFKKSTDRQREFVSKQLKEKDYQETETINGITPLKTGYVARRINEYVIKNKDNDIQGKKTFFSNVDKLRKIGSSISEKYHGMKEENFRWSEGHHFHARQTPKEGKQREHSAKKFKAIFQKSTWAEALNGNLQETFSKENERFNNMRQNGEVKY